MRWAKTLPDLRINWKKCAQKSSKEPKHEFKIAPKEARERIDSESMEISWRQSLSMITLFHPWSATTCIAWRTANTSSSTSVGMLTTHCLLHQRHSYVLERATMLTQISPKLSGNATSVLILTKSTGGGIHEVTTRGWVFERGLTWELW